MVWMMWFILLMLTVFFFNLFIKTMLTPNRKFRQAVKQKYFYMIDDKKNVRKNFLITYKGAVLEGAKYLGTNKNPHTVVSIYIWIRDPDGMEDMGREDFFFIEKKILKLYPRAAINWNNPFYELMR